MEDPGPEGVVRRVRQGETTEGLAAAHHHFWRTVWMHPRNGELRALRANPNVLREGDELFIPPRGPRSESCATTREHVFRVRGVPSRLTVRCLDLLGRPRAGEPFVLVGRDLEVRGTVDPDGWVKTSIAPDLTSAVLTVGDPDSVDVETYELMLGHLDPVDYLEGVCDRLRNLGYYQGPSIEQPDVALHRAIAQFREDQSLPESEEVDDGFRQTLVRAHGS